MKVPLQTSSIFSQYPFSPSNHTPTKILFHHHHTTTTNMLSITIPTNTTKHLGAVSPRVAHFTKATPNSPATRRPAVHSGWASGYFDFIKKDDAARRAAFDARTKGKTTAAAAPPARAPPAARPAPAVNAWRTGFFEAIQREDRAVREKIKTENEKVMAEGGPKFVIHEKQVVRK